VVVYASAMDFSNTRTGILTMKMTCLAILKLGPLRFSIEIGSKYSIVKSRTQNLMVIQISKMWFSPIKTAIYTLLLVSEEMQNVSTNKLAKVKKKE
jgi:hypothetical protein